MPDEGTIAPVTGAPAAPAAPAPAAAPAAVATEQVETFDRAYVEKLRQEAADHRTKAKSYEEAFTGWTDDDKGVWLEAVKTAAADPSKGAEYLRKIAETLSPAQQAALAEEPEKFLTEKELNARLDKERLETDTAQQLRLIKQEATGLGYEDGSEDYFRLMWVAQNKTSLDLKKADEHIKAERQKVIDDFVAEKRRLAEGPTVPVGSAATSEAKPVKTFKDAAEATRERIRQQQAY